ncbi:surface protease GP63 [Trypanosoma rangeli]|uniref:Leishmanolysin-like peptidase n=1 Tax=Trypanosoma rangeli TaxID=5698 RepID=A0A3R7R5R1_TRYRA|nr:surface protease GP63 [Trypanosoma rangeli]RNE96477.1 surface protease GP63 [Trypanosoma rangeli]|eukprot:RNE96477.1 surface protease GP63 [Trypanosoma rangeli]
MRRPRCLAPFIPLVLLLLLLAMHCTGGCLAAASALRHRCNFDEVMRKRGPLPTAVVRELPRKGQGTMQAYTATTKEDEGDWKPIRIRAFVVGANDTSMVCKEAGNVVRGYGGRMKCEETHVLTDAKRKTLEDSVLPRAIKLHTDRLLVKPINGKLIVPRELCGLLKRRHVPEEHMTEGVSDADMVLYVFAGPASGAIAWASSCALLHDGRPVVGVVNVDPQYINGESVDRVVAHEIAHALGFDCQNLRGRGLVSSKYGVRGRPSVTMVTGRNVKEKAAAHFNCDLLEGMELEDYPLKSAGSHWERRNALDELMVSGFSVGRYTALTMAAFEDLGYYKAVWGMAEPMSWGNNSGCEFLTKKCTEINNPATAYPHMLCDASDNATLRCSTERHYVGRCTGNLVDGHLSTRDKCPVVSSFFTKSKNGGSVLSRCSDGSVASLPGSLTGEGSWCLDAESLQAKAGDSSDYASVGGVCAQVQCAGGKVKVKYLGGSGFELCPEGGEIQVTASEHFKDGGKIKCPRYAEVCTVAADGSGLIFDWDELELQRAKVASPHTFSNSGLLPWARNVHAYITGRDGGAAAAAGFSSFALLLVATAAVAALPL